MFPTGDLHGPRRAAFVLSLALCAASACARPAPATGELAAARPHAPGQAQRAAAASSSTAAGHPDDTLVALTRVDDRASVCMLSDRYQGARPHVPVTVDGKTYYGCCANCAARLGNLAAARSAVDPITQHSVDKASAVIARDAQNRLHYFESELSFAQASAGAARSADAVSGGAGPAGQSGSCGCAAHDEAASPSGDADPVSPPGGTHLQSCGGASQRL